MKFTPKTREEIQYEKLLTEGYYSATVVKAEEVKSQKTGMMMIKLQLEVYDQNQRKRPMFDYLMESFAEKLLSFSEAAGLQDKYFNGELMPSDIENSKVQIEVKIKKDEKYGMQNKIEQYFKPDDRKNTATPDIVDDAISF